MKFSRIAKNYCLGGVLYKFNTRPEGWKKLLVIPDKLKDVILNECHNIPLIDRIRRLYYWCGLFKDVETRVRMFIECKTKKGTNQKPASLLQPIPVGEPFDRVGINLLGPFPKTHHGNSNFIDFGIRWAETRAVPAGTTEDVAQFLLDNVECMKQFYK
ncbi:hypothetical protein PR048_005212 [Dryococelus australis]|uniref:Integrase zinc-binding domain-containing protein n=1 Tax=Dryococelus australis TaxID=614101 RepID=A0ABQ9I7L9_9NEOP|nr:hypothetical protein PR048_005212 [Dryococelus australis]